MHFKPAFLSVASLPPALLLVGNNHNQSMQDVTVAQLVESRFLNPVIWGTLPNRTSCWTSTNTCHVISLYSEKLFHLLTGPQLETLMSFRTRVPASLQPACVESNPLTFRASVTTTSTSCSYPRASRAFSDTRALICKPPWSSSPYLPTPHSSCIQYSLPLI